MKEQPSKDILASFRKSGESWLAVKSEVVQTLIQHVIDDRSMEVTRDLAIADLHYWISRSELMPYTYMAKRWRWGEKKAYKLFVELGIYRDGRACPAPARSRRPSDRGSQKGVGRESEGSQEGAGRESAGSREGVEIPEFNPESTNEVVAGESEGSQEGAGGESEGSCEGVGREQYVLEEEGDEEREQDPSSRPAKPEDRPRKGVRRKTIRGHGPLELGYMHLHELPANIRGDPALLKAWKDFVHWRRHVQKRRIPVSRDSAVKLLNKLVDADDPIAMIDQSIENEWTGLFPVKGIPANGTTRRRNIDYDGGF